MSQTPVRKLAVLLHADIVGSTALVQENEYFSQYPHICGFLCAHEVRMMRRPLALQVSDLRWEISENEAIVEFGLARGQYATVVLRELGDFQSVSGAR